MDIPEKPLGCTCFKLRKLTRAMSRLYDQHMATVGLKTTQYSLLVNAARRAAGGRTGRPAWPGAHHAHAQPQAAAGRRWVVLRPGADSRQRIVTITDEGRAKVEQAYVVWRQAQLEFEKQVGRDAVRAQSTARNHHDPTDPIAGGCTP
ncbi:MarR family transcriptional regulator [Massilia sp. B-10]|nr:MarR family transcriptional regulator [Massilia sp. B-10]